MMRMHRFTERLIHIHSFKYKQYVIICNNEIFSLKLDLLKLTNTSGHQIYVLQIEQEHQRAPNMSNIHTEMF